MKKAPKGFKKCLLDIRHYVISGYVLGIFWTLMYANKTSVDTWADVIIAFLIVALLIAGPICALIAGLAGWVHLRSLRDSERTNQA